MAWKQINGRYYYYRSVRDGDRVRSEYVGAGESASLISQMDEIDRQEREEERRESRAERERDETEDRRFDEWFADVETVADSAMVAAGFHRHHRGVWRKRRKRS